MTAAEESPRRAIVTGVGRGVGYAVVSQLLGDGLKVSGTLLRPDPVPSWSATVHLQVADATDRVATSQAVGRAADHMGGIDVVVANAGRGTKQRVLSASDEIWHEQLLNKLTSVTNLLDVALPHLRQSSSPRIVVIGGVTGLSPEVDQGVVSALRAAQINLVTNLANELASDRICINTVLLGAILTDRQRDKFAHSGSTDFDRWCVEEVDRRGIPFGRFGTAEEVAALVSFLVSEPAGYITGAAIPISGGLGI